MKNVLARLILLALIFAFVRSPAPAEYIPISTVVERVEAAGMMVEVLDDRTRARARDIYNAVPPVTTQVGASRALLVRLPGGSLWLGFETEQGVCASLRIGPDQADGFLRTIRGEAI